MAISFVNIGSSQTGVNPTINIPFGVNAGDLLIIFMNSSGAITTPSGWTPIQTTATQVWCVYKIAGPSESAVTITGGTSGSRAVMAVYRGTKNIDATATVKSATSTSGSTNTLTTNFANDFVITFFAPAAGGIYSMTNPSGTNVRLNTSSSTTIRGILIADELQSSQGTSTSRTTTFSISNAWNSLSFAISPTNNNFFFLMS